MLKRFTRKIWVVLLVFTFLAIPFFNLTAISARQVLADANDSFQFFSPGPAGAVKGQSVFGWQVSDNNQSTIPFEINLKDNARCAAVLRPLASGRVISSSSQQFTSWNSTTVADGSYCVEICVSLVGPSGNYSACSARRIVVRNAVPQQPPVAPAPTPVAPTPPTAPIEETVMLKFISPKAGEVFSGHKNAVAWQLTGVNKVSDLSILYSTDGSAWIKLSDLAVSQTSFSWDVSKFTNGNYYLKLVAKIGSETFVEATSGKFSISNAGKPDVVLTKPIIFDLSPSNDAVLRDRRPILSGKFSAPSDSKINTDSFIFRLNGSDQSDLCEVAAEGFVCLVDQDLPDGKYELEVSIADDQDRGASKSWQFQIGETPVVEEVPTAPDSPDVIILLGQEVSTKALALGMMVCCAALLLLIIPWLIFVLWRNRQGEEDEFQTVIHERTDAVPNVKVNYYSPDQSVVDQSKAELAEIGITPVAVETTTVTKRSDTPEWLSTQPAEEIVVGKTLKFDEAGNPSGEFGAYGYGSKIDN